MATVYSSEVSVGTYNRIRLKCDYSGTSASFDIQFRRTASYTGSWADTQATLTFNSQTKAAAYSYSGTVGTSWVTLKSGISGYTISASGGTYSWTFNNPGGSSVLGCSGTITIPAQGTAPSNGYINSLQSTYNSNNNLIEFSASSVGVSTSTALNDAQFRILLTPNTGGGLSYQTVTFTNGGSVTLNQSNSIAGHGGITIVPNQLYYSGIYASNSVGAYYYNGPSIVAPAAPATCSATNITANSVTVSYSTAADGGYYSKNIEYSLNNGSNWTTGAVVSTSSASSGSYTITGRTPNTTYSIRTRVRTTSGSTNGSTLSATTLPAAPTLSVQSLTTTSATISYSTAADGGAYTKTIAYSTNNGSTWTTLTTSSGGSAVSSTFTLSNLTMSTSYTVLVRSVTTAGTSIASITFVTALAKNKMYGGTSSNLTTRITNFYGPVSDLTTKATKIYGSVGGVSKIFYRKYGT